MSDEDVKVWRTLHLKFTLPGAEPEHLLAMMRAAAPFYQLFGNANFRLLRNADDPTKYIQVIEYETHEAFELNRQSLASDMRFQTLSRVGVPCCPVRLRSTSIRKSPRKATRTEFVCDRLTGNAGNIGRIAGVVAGVIQGNKSAR